MNPTSKIAVVRRLPDAFMQGLSQFGEVTVIQSPADAAGCDALVSTAVDPLSANFIADLPDTVRLIANVGVGTDNIDLDAASKSGISVSNTPVVTEDTADLAMTLVLATCRKLGAAERALRAGDWAAGASQTGNRVHGKTLGIVGFGEIGQAVARRAAGFGMKIIYHGPAEKAVEAAELGATFKQELKALLETADIVSLHCPLTADTRHLLDRDHLAAMKSGAILINTGRGPLVDEAALVAALMEGHLAGAGLDVFEFEPQVTPELLQLDNVTLSPHIGSATVECRMDMALRVLANLQNFREHGKPLDVCNELP